MKLNIVPARTGILWVKLGIQTFMKQPLAFTGLFFIYIAVASVLALLPIIGLVLALGLVPAATLGLMAATAEALKGRFPMPTVLVSAFRAGRQRLRAMLVLGFVYAAICMAIIALVPLPVEMPAASGQEAVLSTRFQLHLLVTMILYLPVSLLFWHAPALVHWHGVAPLKSLFFSLMACLRNAKALAMFGLGWLAVSFAFSLVIGLSSLLTGSPELAQVIVAPVALLIAAMFSTSIYFTFRDSFVTTPDDEPQPTPGEST